MKTILQLVCCTAAILCADATVLAQTPEDRDRKEDELFQKYYDEWRKGEHKDIYSLILKPLFGVDFSDGLDESDKKGLRRFLVGPTPEEKRASDEKRRKDEEARKTSYTELHRVMERYSNLRTDFHFFDIDDIVRDTKRIVKKIEYEPLAWYFLGVIKAVRMAKKQEYDDEPFWSELDDGRRELEASIRLHKDYPDLGYASFNLPEAHLWLGAVIAREGFEKAYGKDERLIYSLTLIHNLLQEDGWRDNLYLHDYFFELPFYVREYFEDANEEWQRAIELDDGMREIFDSIIVKVLSGWNGTTR